MEPGSLNYQARVLQEKKKMDRTEMPTDSPPLCSIQGVSPNVSGEPRCKGEKRDLKEEVNTQGGGARK